MKEKTAAYEASLKAQREANEADRQARIQHEAEVLAEHKEQMTTQREEFEIAYRNVWTTGPTGVSMVQFTADSVDQAEVIISKAF